MSGSVNGLYTIGNCTISIIYSYITIDLVRNKSQTVDDLIAKEQSGMSVSNLSNIFYLIFSFFCVSYLIRPKICTTVAIRIIFVSIKYDGRKLTHEVTAWTGKSLRHSKKLNLIQYSSLYFLWISLWLHEFLKSMSGWQSR